MSSETFPSDLSDSRADIKRRAKLVRLYSEPGESEPGEKDKRGQLDPKAGARKPARKPSPPGVWLSHLSGTGEN